MANIKLEDFKKHSKHKGYFVRDLGDNGCGYGSWVEVVRADGYGFGAMMTHIAEAAIVADKANPAPSTGATLADIFG